MFALHPSSALVAIFRGKPYQGADPKRADFIFVGLDANYDAQIETTPIFPRLLEYHADGVAFWRKYGVHHPFLLPGYRGDGRLYHRSFARIGFTAAHAHLVSFVELLHMPTVGRNVLTPTDFSAEHLAWLDALIREGRARHVFVPDKVANLMRKTRHFPWLPRTRQLSSEGLSTWFTQGPKKVYCHLHLSTYGKFESRKTLERGAIAALIPDAMSM